MASKSRLFSKILGEGAAGTIPVESLSSTVPLGPEEYTNAANLPASGNNVGDQAFVSSTGRLYIWTGTGWYNIALVNSTPTWDSNGEPSATYDLASDGTATTITLLASDPEGLVISYTATADSGLDAIASISQNNNQFTITPLFTIDDDSAQSGSGTITFRATDGVNILPAVSTFNINFSLVLENSRYTVALITSAGTVGSNKTFLDSSPNNITITPSGDAVLNTVSPYRPGGYSWYFDGSGDYITTPTNAITIGTNDFTYEAWIYPTGSPGWGQIIGPAYDTTGIVLFYNSGNLTAYGSVSLLSWIGILQLNVWQHVVLTRENGILYLYHNGIKYGSSAVNSYNLTNSQYRIGTNLTGSEAFIGYIRDARIVNGTAVYTSNYTVPTEPLENIANTALLTCHLPYLKDGSSNNFVLTATGNVKSVQLGFYDYTEYDSSVNGGSVYFDGTGDFLTVTNGSWKTYGSNDFTIEFWMYPDVTTDKAVFGDTQSSGVGDACTVIAEWKSSGNYLSFDFRVGATKYSLATNNPGDIRPYSWSHIAFVRSGTSFKTYVNGNQQTGTQTLSGDMNVSANNFFIGNFYNGYNAPFKGYISDFRITNGTAVYTSDFIPPSQTLISNSSALHLTGSGSNIVDKSQSGLIKVIGNVTTSTVQSKYLGSSIYFDGNGDNISISEIDSFKMRTGDFTIEGWTYIESDTDSVSYIASKYFSSGDTDGWRITLFTNGGNFPGRFVVYIAGNAIIAPSTYDVNHSEWTHFALTREGTTLKLFTNGILTQSVTNSTDLIANTQPILLGVNGSNGNYLKGYLEDFRVTKGLARYTANFTPPTASFEG
jgi:hypothetical protein